MKRSVLKDITTELSQLTDDRAVRRLVWISLGRILYRNHAKTGAWLDLYQAHTDEIRHVVDWLNSAIIDKDEWLQRVDHKGRPLKLTKMHSISQLHREADKSFAKKIQKLGATTILSGDESVVMELEDGFVIVKMLTEEALDRESLAMQHCIGMGSYDRHLKGQRIGLYSLRDRHNKPHVTMEIDHKENTLLQLKGKQNAMPVARYLSLISPFIQAEKITNASSAKNGFVFTKGPIVHHASNIPDGLEFDQSLSFLDYMPEDNVRIPTGISVEGNLLVSEHFARLLETEMSVTKDVHACGIEHLSVSSDFKFGGGLNLEGSSIIFLHDGLHVHGDFILRGTTNAWEDDPFPLPQGLVVDKDLDLTDSEITEIDGGTIVKGNLLIGSAPIVELAPGMTIGQTVFLGGNKSLTVIPPGFSAGGNLMLRGSSIRYISEDVFIGGMISIDADIADEFFIHERAEIIGGIRFRPVPGKANFHGKLTMDVDEFRSLSQSALTPRAVSSRF